jgi:predicted branched-subunit amino acid permease
MMMKDLVSGMRAMLPWLAGVAPFGMVIGVSASQTHLPAGAGWLTAPVMFGGSAQIAAIQLLDAGAAPIAVIVTVMVINLRLALYSAAMAKYWRGTPLWWRLLGGYLLVDPTFAVGIERYAVEPDRRRGHAHYLGGGIVLWIGWLAAVAIGATVGASVPSGLHLEMLVPLFLIGELIPKLRTAATRWAMVVSATVALLCLTVPLHLGIAVGIVAGIAAGWLAVRPARPERTGPELSTPELSTEELSTVELSTVELSTAELSTT